MPNLKDLLSEGIWKAFPIDKNYFVSTDGEIVSTKTNKKLINIRNTKTGYYSVNIGGKLMYVHRVVAMTFLEMVEEYPIVDHIDRNPNNNCVNNLRWCTYRQNSFNRPHLGSVRRINVKTRIKSGEKIYVYYYGVYTALIDGEPVKMKKPCCSPEEAELFLEKMRSKYPR